MKGETRNSKLETRTELAPLSPGDIDMVGRLCLSIAELRALFSQIAARVDAQNRSLRELRSVMEGIIKRRVR